MEEKLRFKILQDYFAKYGFVRHQVESFDDFITFGIPRVVSEADIHVENENQKYHISFGHIHVPSPIVLDDDRKVKELTPKMCRDGDITYDSPIYVDVVEKFQQDDKEIETSVYRRVMLGRVPVMLRSEICNLSKLTPEEKIKNSECEWDQGGYFIIKGRERVLIPQVRGIYNQPIILKQKPGDKYKYSCEIRSMSEETGHSVLIQLKITHEGHIAISLPYIKDIIPIGVFFKALGFLKAEDILNLLGLDKFIDNEQIQRMLKTIIRESYFITTRDEALEYIGQYAIHTIKEDTYLKYGKQVIENELLTHQGITSTMKEKGYFFGTMVNKLVRVFIGLRVEDDRDNYANKRIETAGILCCELFRMLFKKFTKDIQKRIKEKKQRPDLLSIISRSNIITMGIRCCFCFPAGTLITMANGTSIPIEKLCNKGIDTEKIYGWSGTGLKVTNHGGLIKQGVKDTIKLTFQDGRTLICTPDHKILVEIENCKKWVEASEIPLNSRIVMGLENPIDDFDEDLKCGWEHEIHYNFKKFILNFSSIEERNKNLAFARILGYVICNEYIPGTEIYFGTLLDFNNFREDYKLLGFEKELVVIDENTDLYKTNICVELTNIFKAIDRKRGIPSFLLTLCPKSFLREFLGGFFGAKGHSPYLCKKKNYIEGVTLSCATKNVFEDVLSLLKQVGVNDAKTDKLIIQLQPNIEFLKNVGFRYAIHKSYKLSIASSYWRSIDNLNPNDFIKEIGASYMFEDEYVCKRNESELPYFTLKLVDKRLHKPQIVYDITDVDICHSFLANGLVVSNSSSNWGIQKNAYIRTGVSQVLSRLTYGATLSHLRRLALPVGKEGKNAKIRQLHSSQIMYICSTETPEGHSIGTVLNLSLLTLVTRRVDTVFIKEVIESSKNIILINDDHVSLSNVKTRVYLNGILLGLTDDYQKFIDEMKYFRHSHIFHEDVSFTYDNCDNEIRIFSDEGRLKRPLFTMNDDNKLKITPADISLGVDETEPSSSINSMEQVGHKGLNNICGKNIKEFIDWDDLVEKGLIRYIDNSEIENCVVAMDETDFPKYKSELCEIHPSMMFGVMASNIPYAEHNQCIFYKEHVWMGDGTTKQISDVMVGDKVITFDPKTQKQSITNVTHTYTNMTKKQLFDIITYNGRKITATFDHQFMTDKGWMRLEHLQPEETLIALSLEPLPVSIVCEEYLILDDDSFIKECVKGGIKHNTAIKYSKELRHILPLKSNSKYLPIISRLFGFILTDCWVDSTKVRMGADFGAKYSAELFEQDVEYLGLTIKKIDFSENFEYGSTYRVAHNGSFVALFIALGITRGKKTTQPACKIPFWVMKGSEMTKREFLAGFQGGDGSKIKEGQTTQIHIQMASTTKTIEDKYLNTLIEMMTDIVKLFRDLSIEVQDVEYKKSRDVNRMNVSYYINNKRTNLIKYFEKVNYRYDILKQVESGKLVEYMKYLEYNLTQKVKNYGNVSRQIIASELGIDIKNVYNLLRLSSETNGLPKGLLTARQWLKKIQTKSTTIYVPILKIVESAENIISDITVEAEENQSFLCGDRFCVHNSPRLIYQAAQGKQAMGVYALSHQTRSDTITHVLDYPQRPFVSTVPAKILGFDDMPSGINAVVAIMCYTGFKYWTLS